MRAALSTARARFPVPPLAVLCEKALEEAGVYTLLRVRECALSFYVLEDDVLSLEAPPTAYRQLFVDGDTAHLHAAAQGLAKLQALFGRAALVRGKGFASQIVIRVCASPS